MKVCRRCQAPKDENDFSIRCDGYRFGVCKECIRRRQRSYTQRDPAEQVEFRRAEGRLKQRKHRLKVKFGITEERFQELLRQQDGKCAICGGQPYGRHTTLCVDHDHVTGRIRGLLCNRCNTSLGWVEKWRKRAESYLDGDME